MLDRDTHASAGDFADASVKVWPDTRNGQGTPTDPDALFRVSFNSVDLIFWLPHRQQPAISPPASTLLASLSFEQGNCPLTSRPPIKSQKEAYQHQKEARKELVGPVQSHLWRHVTTRFV